MSKYNPRPDLLRVVKRDDGWWVDDPHGPLDGPYETEGDAYAVLRGYQEAQ